MLLRRLPNDIVTLVYICIHRHYLSHVNMQLLDTDRSKNPWSFEPHTKSARCSICRPKNGHLNECYYVLNYIDNYIRFLNGKGYALKLNSAVSKYYKIDVSNTFHKMFSEVFRILNVLF